MTTQTKEQLMSDIITNISNILRDQSSINNAQTEMNSELIKQFKDLKFRVEQIENQLNKGDK
jgi:hypothetical protein